jgi:hypothetical protein
MFTVWHIIFSEIFNSLKFRTFHQDGKLPKKNLYPFHQSGKECGIFPQAFHRSENRQIFCARHFTDRKTSKSFDPPISPTGKPPNRLNRDFPPTGKPPNRLNHDFPPTGKLPNHLTHPFHRPENLQIA